MTRGYGRIAAGQFLPCGRHFLLAKQRPADTLFHLSLNPKNFSKHMAAKTEEQTSEQTKVNAARNKNLDLAIQQIAKDYGEGAIMRLGGGAMFSSPVVNINGRNFSQRS